MKVLVTGGDGFIGQATVKMLRKHGHEVDVFDIRRENDITSHYYTVRALKSKDAVIHLAGLLGTHELFDNPYDAMDVNIKGTLNVLEGCVEHRVRYVGIGMLEVFPSIYTATKIASKAFITAYHHNYGIPVTNVRAFNAYGPEQLHGPGHPRKIIPALSIEGWRNEPLKLWGDGSQMVDLIHVDAVADVLVQALNAPGQNETIDAGTRTGMTVNDVADIVLQVTGSTAGVEHLPMRRGEIPTQIIAEGEGWEYLIRHPEYDELKLIQTICSYRDQA